MLTFGPTDVPITYPETISALSQDVFQWQITFTLTDTTIISGLVSRDEYGQVDPGHLTVWVENGVINVRNQDIAGGAPNAVLQSTTIVMPDVEYVISVSMDVGVGIGLFVNGIHEASSPVAFGLTGNNLPLVLGARCQTCTDTNGPTNPIQGTVYLEIIDVALPIPPPIVGAVMLNWEPSVEYEDDTPILPGELTDYFIYNAADASFVAAVDGEDTAYEVSGLSSGTHCFVATAVANSRESLHSNTVCNTIPTFQE